MYDEINLITSSMNMSIPDDEKFVPADLREPSLLESSDVEDDMPIGIPPSEIATRINLLGKLIIPRSPH